MELLQETHPENADQAKRQTSSLAWRLLIAACFGLVVALVTFNWWVKISPWVGSSVFIAAAALIDIPAASRQVIPIPNMAILICSLQYCLAAWLSFYFPSLNDEYMIADHRAYFEYIGPALSLIALAWAAFGFRASNSPPRVRLNTSAALLKEFDWLLGVGFFAALFGSRFSREGVAFVIVLVANLRYVGLVGWLLSGNPGWKKRILIVSFLELSMAAGSGMFHELILWTLSVLAILVFVSEIKPFLLIAFMGTVAFVIFSLQDAKWTIREAAWGGSDRVEAFGTSFKYSRWTRPFVSALCVLDSGTKWLRDGYSRESIAEALTRFNQGWIISRVLEHVPGAEPYARGTTVTRALESAFLPRVLAPNKAIAGGRENMARYAGLDLNEATSMNLGFAGEMYANFGYAGGVLACGVYALVLALAFRWVSAHAHYSPLWWSVVIYSGHWALKAEDDVAGVLNYLIKAGVVFFLTLRFLPAFREELNRRQVSLAALSAGRKEYQPPADDPALDAPIAR